MPMYILLEYNGNYSITSGSLWNYYKDEVNGDENENNNAKNRKNNSKAITNKHFEYKRKIMGRTPDGNNTLKVEVAVPSKYFSNFRRFLDLPSVNCEIEPDLSWSKNCIVSEIVITPRISANSDANPPVREVAATLTTGATFQINNAKLYVPFTTLFVNDIIKFLENIKQGFKRTISRNKY